MSSAIGWWLGIGGALTLVLMRNLDLRGRARWRAVGGRAHTAGGPYRSATLQGTSLVAAPAWVRGATLGSLVFALGAMPAVYLVLDTPHFDGIAVPLLPGLLLSIASACCVGLLLARATDDASSAARLAGRTSLFFHGSLSVLALAHLVVVETDWGSQVHSCSRSLALAVLALALGATAQAFGVVRAADAREQMRTNVA